MTKGFAGGFGGGSWHPAEERLLLHVDGELPTREAEEVEQHLEACWSCRARTERIQDTISTFAEFVDRDLQAGLPPPPREWTTFGPSLRRRAEAVEKDSWRAWARKVLSLLSPPRTTTPVIRFATATAVVIVTLAILARTKATPTVSASELLRRASTTRSDQVRRVERPVVYQRLQVRRRAPKPEAGDALTWEIWNDVLSARYRQRAFDVGAEPESNAPPSVALPTLLAEFGSVLDVNGMDPRSPLSSATFDRWRGSIVHKDESVEKTQLANGEEAFVLTTAPRGTVGVGLIEEARLVVRASDWHPVEEHLRVVAEGGPREYDLIETGFDVVPLRSIAASIFDDREPPAPVLAEQAAPLPTAAELQDAEIGARYALHKAEADLGEALEIVRRRDGIEVRGLAETADRKATLVAALTDIPHLRTNITAVEEVPVKPEAVKSGSRTTGARSGSTGGDALQVVGGQAPIQPLLEQYLAERRAASGRDATRETESLRDEASELSRQALTHSDRALSHAWALRRLAERYSSEEIARLTPESRRMLETMVRDHVQALRDRVGRSYRLLKPVEAAVAARPTDAERGRTPEEGPSRWPAASSRVFRDVMRADVLTTRLFTAGGALVSPGTDASTSAPLRFETPAASLRALVETLVGLSEDLDGLEGQLSPARTKERQ